jgi:hypothetical protein
MTRADVTRARFVFAWGILCDGNSLENNELQAIQLITNSLMAIYWSRIRHFVTGVLV